MTIEKHLVAFTAALAINKDENKFDFYRRLDAFLAKNLAPRAP